MHAPPFVHMNVNRFAVWQFSCVGVLFGVGSSWARWVVAANGTRPVALAVGSAVLLACAMAVAWAIWRSTPVQLRWDTQAWQVTEGRGQGQPEAGSLGVALDLGGFMLLYFLPASRSRFRGAEWLPVQRRGHEAAWHSLRLTLYGARSAQEPSAVPL